MALAARSRATAPYLDQSGEIELWDVSERYSMALDEHAEPGFRDFARSSRRKYVYTGAAVAVAAAGLYFLGRSTIRNLNTTTEKAYASDSF